MSREIGPGHASPKVVVGALVKSCVAVAGLIFAYFMFPLGEKEDPLLGVFSVVVGLGIFSAVFVRQLRQIRRADHPVLRAIEAIAMVGTTFVVVMASIHFICSEADPKAYTEVLSRLDAIYFVVTTLATVGFGDITPTTDLTRSITTVQMILGIALLGAGVRALISVAQQAIEDRQRSGPEAAQGIEDSRPGQP